MSLEVLHTRLPQAVQYFRSVRGVVVSILGVAGEGAGEAVGYGVFVVWGKGGVLM